MMNYSVVLLLFALCSIVAASPMWFDEEEPMNLRAFRVMPNQLDSIDASRRLLKRASMFNKRRGRELFGKRSLPIEYPDETVMYESRFRRRANELFG
ncbi:THR-like peptide hormone [Caenorhabditis elegans]|uniref:THR-like peptide hormone n=1 Tax=Caenorhabditis elegans TaxID=6239 RepID=Q8MQB1_CAEEL|nr:THR-like peptide hormone [Caenorhabditis elegans]CAD42644.1 THR-like peptide hormone [Caenorhabditis elegans]|eukprot:NP_741499.1 THR-like peptide hormone [Caenorhabditis elegans]